MQAESQAVDDAMLDFPHVGYRNFKYDFSQDGNLSRDGLTVNRVNFRQGPLFF